MSMQYAELLAQAQKRILHQDEALKKLAVILYYHLQAMDDFEASYAVLFKERQSRIEKNALPEYLNDPLPLPDLPEKPEPMGSAPIFLLGKTGSGKTHLVRELCKLSGVNFITVNTTHLSNSGYKGMNLADVGQSIVEQAGHDITKQLFSVIFFDEFDKLFMPMSEHQASFQRGLATELLTVMEGTSFFPVKDQQGIESGYMLFILGGSFALHQTQQTSIGFLAHNTVDYIPKNQLDFLKMGFFEELAGRIGHIIPLAPINKHMLMDILKYSPSSPLVKLQRQFYIRFEVLEVDDDFIEDLIDNHQENIEKFGVRGLYQAFNALPYLYDLLISVAERLNKHGYYCLKKEGLVFIEFADDLDI